LIGDLNINLLDNNSQNTAAYLDLLSNYSFLPLILTPTRTTAQSSTLIDHIMYNGFKGTKSYSGNIFADVSDHLPNYAIIPFTNSKSHSKDRPHVRLNSENNILNFIAAVNDTDWSIDPINDCKTAFNHFYDTFQDCFQKFFPLVKLSISQFKRKPWLIPPLF
jgi:hypothetical protein